MQWAALTVQAWGVLLTLVGVGITAVAIKRRRMWQPVIEPSRPARRRGALRLGIGLNFIGVASIYGGVVWHAYIVDGVLSFIVHETGRSLAAAVLAISVILGSIGWWYRPVRAGRRCPKCLYDCTSVPGPTCPECGFTRPEWSLFERGIRSRSLLIASILLALAAPFAYRAPRAIQTRSALNLVPTTFMILAWKYISENTMFYRDGALDSRFHQYGGMRAWDWQLTLLVRATQREISRPASIDSMERAMKLHVAIAGAYGKPITDEAVACIIRDCMTDTRGDSSYLATEPISTAIQDAQQANPKPSWYVHAIDELRRRPDVVNAMFESQFERARVLRSLYGSAAATDEACWDRLVTEFDRDVLNAVEFSVPLMMAVMSRPDREPWLREYIESSKGGERLAAAFGVYSALTDNPNVVPTLQRWADGPNPILATLSIFPLCRMPDSGWTIDRVIEKFASDPVKYIGLTMVIDRNEICDPRVLGALTRILVDQSALEGHRDNAARRLGAAGLAARDSLPVLESVAANDVSPLVRDAARGSIKTIREAIEAQNAGESEDAVDPDE